MPALHRFCRFLRIISCCGALLLGSCFADPSAFAEQAEARAEPQNPQPTVSDVFTLWNEEVEPILRDHCIRCHGAAKQSSALSLQSITGLLSGGDRGPAVDHESPEASLLIEVLSPDADPHMPPDEQLDDEQIVRIREWVTAATHVDQDELAALAQNPESQNASASSSGTPYPANVAPSLVIDMAVQAGWHSADDAIEPAGRCDDSTFVRRVYLDLTGRIPTAEQRQAFLAETISDKRERLIDELLASPEHAEHMAELFDTVLMGRGGVGQMKRRQRHGWTEFLTDAFAENRPWDQVAREILLARPESAEGEDAGATWYLYERQNEHQQIAEAVSRGVFGVQIQCAQCHDHPLAAEIKQAHYWGLVAFFNRGENQDTPVGPRIVESAIGGFSNFTNLEGESQPNRLVYLQADVVEEPRPETGKEQEDSDELYKPGEREGAPRVPRFSRRQKFVDEVLHDHPLVARAMVNRLWALMMGRGIVHPVDQLDSVHPPSHPELLDWLAEDFEQNGYDVRRLLSQIARSQTYQLSSKSDEFVDPTHFAVAAVKPLSAETLYRALLIALDSSDPDSQQTPERLAEFRSAFPDVLPEESIGSLRQALLLTNGPDIHALLSPERSGTMRELLKLAEPEAISRAAFVRVLGREATEEELQRTTEFLKARTDRTHRGVDHLVWALLTGAEFRFNH